MKFSNSVSKCGLINVQVAFGLRLGNHCQDNRFEGERTGNIPFSEELEYLIHGFSTEPGLTTDEQFHLMQEGVEDLRSGSRDKVCRERCISLPQCFWQLRRTPVAI